MAPFDFVHEPGQHPDHASTLRQCAIGERSHRTGFAAAIDDSDAIAREDRAEARRRIMIKLVALPARCAINTDSIDRHRGEGTEWIPTPPSRGTKA